MGFLTYWVLCIGFTGAAIVVAFADARAVRQNTRQEQRALLETTLKDIEAEAQRRKRDGTSRERKAQTGGKSQLGESA